MNVKHNNNSSFPDSSTFYNKLGLTNELAQTILEYAKERKGYRDIESICNSVLDKFKDRGKFSESQGITSGFVYLGKQHGKYKIGKSKNAQRRRDDITLLGSEPFEPIHEIQTDDMTGVEKYWHDRFKSKRLRGEWFNLNPSDVKAFKRWKKIF